MQWTTRRVNNKRDLFKTLTSMNIASDHRSCIIHRVIELGYKGNLRASYAFLTWVFHKLIVLQIERPEMAEVPQLYSAANLRDSHASTWN